MPVDKMYTDPMLNTFRDMLKDVLEVKKLSGKDVDEMSAAMAEMERLAVEMDDMMSFSTKLTTENLFMRFSNAYSKALASAAQSQGQPTDDAGLLTQSLKAYEDAYNTLLKDPKNKYLLPPLQKLIQLGKSGVSYPVFLRRAEEQGLFAEMNSGTPGPVIDFEIHCAEVMGYPLDIEMQRKIKSGVEALSAKHPFKVADPLEFRLMRQKIEWEYAPARARWKATVERWERLIDMVADWLDAHCAFAPHDERWIDMAGAARTAINIARTKECNPGKIAVRESVFREYFGLTWNDIWAHETYTADQKACRIWNSDARMDLIREAYQSCKPGGAPAAELIAKTEALFKSGNMRNPKHLERFGTPEKPGPGYKFKEFIEFVV